MCWMLHVKHWCELITISAHLALGKCGKVYMSSSSMYLDPTVHIAMYPSSTGWSFLLTNCLPFFKIKKQKK